MISKSRLISQIRKSRLKVKVRETDKDDLKYLCSMLAREARYTARMSNDMSCDNISFAINAVSVVDFDIGYYLLYCVGYYETDKILKSIRRHIRRHITRYNRKKLEGVLK